MTDFAPLLVADRGQKAHAVHLVDKDSFADWLKGQPQPRRNFLNAQRFDGKTAFQSAIVPGGSADEFEVVTTVANVRSLSPWCLARLPDVLPEGTYRLAQGAPGKAALGWLLGQHRFDAFRSKPEEAERGPHILVTPEPAAIEPTVRLAQATVLVRDLVNTPALQLGPAELEQAVRDQLDASSSEIRVTSGDALGRGLSTHRRGRRPSVSGPGPSVDRGRLANAAHRGSRSSGTASASIRPAPPPGASRMR